MSNHSQGEIHLKTCHLIGSSFVALALCACAQSAGVDPPPKPTNPASEAPTPQQMRLIVGFRQTGVHDAPALLHAIRVQTHADQLTYVAALTPLQHVYVLQLPKERDPADAINALRRMPEIASVELDAKSQPHK